MKPETMMIDEVKYVRADRVTPERVIVTDQNANHPAIGKCCVIRTYSAGVHIGEVVAVDNRNVALKNSRRLYQWSGAFTLSAVAQYGIKDGKVACIVPELYLSEAIEIIPMTDKAAGCIMGFKEHTP
jgi:hypothetical protein